MLLVWFCTTKQKKQQRACQKTGSLLFFVCEQRGKRESREEVGLSILPDVIIIHDGTLSLVNGL